MIKSKTQGSRPNKRKGKTRPPEFVLKEMQQKASHLQKLLVLSFAKQNGERSEVPGKGWTMHHRLKGGIGKELTSNVWDPKARHRVVNMEAQWVLTPVPEHQNSAQKENPNHRTPDQCLPIGTALDSTFLIHVNFVPLYDSDILTHHHQLSFFCRLLITLLRSKLVRLFTTQITSNLISQSYTDAFLQSFPEKIEGRQNSAMADRLDNESLLWVWIFLFGKLNMRRNFYGWILDLPNYHSRAPVFFHFFCAFNWCKQQVALVTWNPVLTATSLLKSVLSKFLTKSATSHPRIFHCEEKDSGNSLHPGWPSAYQEVLLFWSWICHFNDPYYVSCFCRFQVFHSQIFCHNGRIALSNWRNTICFADTLLHDN